MALTSCTHERNLAFVLIKMNLCINFSRTSSTMSMKSYNLAFSHIKAKESKICLTFAIRTVKDTKKSLIEKCW